MKTKIKLIFVNLMLMSIAITAYSKDKGKIIIYELPSANGVSSNLQEKYMYILENINKKVFSKYEIELRQCYFNSSVQFSNNLESEGKEIINKKIKIDPCKDPSSFINAELSKLNNLALIKYQYDYAVPRMVNSIKEIDEAYEGNLKFLIDSVFKESDIENICFIIGNSYKPIKNHITFSKYEYESVIGSLIKLVPNPSSDKVLKYVWYPENDITIYPNYAEVVSKEFEQVLRAYYLDDNNCYSDTAEIKIIPITNNETEIKKTINQDYYITNNNSLKFLFEDQVYSSIYLENENETLKGEWVIKSSGNASFEYYLYTSPFIADKYKILINEYIETNNFKGYKKYKELIYNKIDVEADENGNLKFIVGVEPFKDVKEVEVLIYSSTDGSLFEIKDSKKIVLKHCN